MKMFSVETNMVSDNFLGALCCELVVYYCLSKYIFFAFQIDGNGNPPDRVSGSAKGLSWTKPLLSFAANNFLPLGEDVFV